MTKKVVFSICTAMIVVFFFGFFKVNFLDRKESKLTVTNVDLQENCIYAIAKNQLYDADDEYIIHGASDYLKGQVQLSQIKEGETIIVISNGKVLQSDTSRWDARLKAALHKRHPVLKRVLVAALTLVILTLGALAVSADFRKAVYTMIQKFLPIEMQLTYQVDGEPLEQLPNGYSDHYVPDGFERDREQEFERAENFLHVYSSKESGEGYTVRCSIIQPGQQSSFDNEHTTYKNVKVGDADATLGTSVGESGDTVYILSWEQGGVSNTIMGNISRDEIVRIAENIF